MIVNALLGGPDASIKNVNVQCVNVIAIALLGVTVASMENANVTFIGYQNMISFIFIFIIR